MTVSLELARLWTARPEWMDHAACRGMPTDWWFPPRGDSGSTIPNALAVCAECPVRTECADAGRNEVHGLWGGGSAKVRVRQLRAARPPDARRGPVPTRNERTR